MKTTPAVRLAVAVLGKLLTRAHGEGLYALLIKDGKASLYKDEKKAQGSTITIPLRK